MGLETVTLINDLVITNPTSSDPRSEGDDHLRNIKKAVKATFPNLTAAVTPTAVELNHVGGATGNIQTQLNAKVGTAGGTMTGDLTMNASSIIEAEGAAVASAATTNIWAGDGNTVHVTGSVTITSFGTAPQAGARMKVIFDGTPLLTQSANLNLNAATDNIQIEAGDWAEVYADTTTQFDVVVHRKSGQAINAIGLNPSGLIPYEGILVTAGLSYLTTSQSTGSAGDTKLGTVAITLSFTNAASVVESILDFGASSFFNVSRTTTGNITVTAKNAAGSIIMSMTTSGNPCATAGRYTILASWNLTTPGTGCMYINNISNYTEVTYTNDTIDYTHSAFNIGSLVGGASALSASIYVVYFHDQVYTDFRIKTERAKFVDEALNINFMGIDGSLVTTSTFLPYIFLAYSYELYNGFLTPRGRSNIQSISTRPAEAPTKLQGYYDARVDLYNGVTIPFKTFQTNNTTTLVGLGDVAASGVLSDFGMLLRPGSRYIAEIQGVYTADLTTTGCRIVLKQPTDISARIEQTLTATTFAVNYVTGPDLPAGATATSLLAGNIYNIVAFLATGGAAVHFMIAFAAETGGGTIEMRLSSSTMKITKIR
jgi:hypothetical protein